MTSLKEILEGIGDFIEKLFHNEKVKDALEDAGRAAAVEIAEFAAKKAAETENKVDDLMAVAAVTALKMKIQPVDGSKLNN